MLPLLRPYDAPVCTFRHHVDYVIFTFKHHVDYVKYTSPGLHSVFKRHMCRIESASSQTNADCQLSKTVLPPWSPPPWSAVVCRRLRNAYEEQLTCRRLCDAYEEHFTYRRLVRMRSTSHAAYDKGISAVCDAVLFRHTQA